MSKEIIYRKLTAEEIEFLLFRHFERWQVVNLCWRKKSGKWVILEDHFVVQWSAEDYTFLVQCLKHTICSGGVY